MNTKKKHFNSKENTEEEVVPDAQQDDAQVDDLLPDDVTKADEKKEVEIKEWAVEVDVTQKLDDFHQKVPNMAKKVSILYIFKYLGINCYDIISFYLKFYLFIFTVSQKGFLFVLVTL